MKVTSFHFVQYLTGVRVKPRGGPEFLVDDALRCNHTWANSPASQQYIHGGFAIHAPRLRMAGAQMLTSTQSSIPNSNAAHPLYFSRLSPRQAGLCVPLVAALRRLRVYSLTELQGALVPLLLKGKHVVAHAETGSGKSFGIALGISNRIARESINYRLHTVILVPTEELAYQYAMWLRYFNGYASQVVQVAVESTSLENQLTLLHNIQPHVLVGTVQRVAEVNAACPTIIGEKLRKRVDCIVLDEADAILEARVGLSQGKGPRFGYELVERLYRDRVEEIPAQIIAVSATIDGPTAQRLNFWTRNEKAVRLTSSIVEYHIPESILFYFTPVRGSLDILEVALDVIDLVHRHHGDGAKLLVFATRDTEVVSERINQHFSRDVAGALQRGTQRGSNACDIAAETQERRGTIYGTRKEIFSNNSSNLSRFHRGELRVGVGHPSGSRGLHLSGVSHVLILIEEQLTTANFVHCCGRTGRLGKEGEVFTIFAPRCASNALQICEALEIPFKRTTPSAIKSASTTALRKIALEQRPSENDVGARTIHNQYGWAAEHGEEQSNED